MNGPLDGVKVLDLTMLLPGPLCTQHLGDMGAEIIKVENPKVPDMTRLMREGDTPPYLFQLINRNKKAITVNLKRPDGQAVIHKLLADTDILVEGFRPGAMGRMGLSYDDLKEKFPKLIYCSISGYGQDGPYADRAGHDGNYISFSGLLGITGDKSGRPVLPGVQIADIGGGTLTALSGILAALYSREKTGQGQYVDVSMTDGAAAFMGLHLGNYLATKEVPQAGDMMLSGRLPNYDCYETADGRWVMLGALEERFMRSFLRSQGLEKKLEEFGFKGGERSTNPPEVMDKIRNLIADTFKAKPLAEWDEHFKNPDTCLSPIKTIPEMLEDEQLKAREMVLDEEHPQFGPYKTIGSPFKFSGTPVKYRNVAPDHGQHTNEVLAGLGYSSEEIENLRKKRMI